MDAIELFKKAAAAMQTDERYLALDAARRANDENKGLQDMIGEFNLKRMNLSNASNGENVDQEKISRLNIELRDCYDDIMENANMVAYNEAKDEFDAVMQRITAILQASAQGEDPDTADVQPSCSGNCDSCGGCH